MNHAVATDEVLEEARTRWDRGETPDAGMLLGDHPELDGRKSLVIELAYEEYFRRVDAGDTVDVDSFCRRFPACRLSLQRRIEVHEFLQDGPVWLSDISWPRPGDEFLRFGLLEELGRGAASRVFLAEERDLSNRLVVVKVSTHGYREAQILSRLEHPNIVPVYSVDEDEERDLVSICMPFVSRWTLLDLLDAAYGAGPPPARFATAIERLWGIKPRGGGGPGRSSNRSVSTAGFFRGWADSLDGAARRGPAPHAPPRRASPRFETDQHSTHGVRKTAVARFQSGHGRPCSVGHLGGHAALHVARADSFDHA